MATDRQVASNRRNGALSRGPKTLAGKARSSRNAVKHGLSIAITSDRASSREIEVLARKLAGAGDSLGQARLAAEAELELNRVRGAFEAVLTRAGVGGGVDEAERAAALIRALPELEKLDRYERRAFSKRKRALLNL
jgi:hypothetical protein